MPQVQPAITVIIPCYNCAAFIDQAINSVQSQTFTDFELLIIDDGSTSQTAQFLSAYVDDSHIRIIHHEHNKGLSIARNTGIRQARGELIAFLDADDRWLPDKLGTQIKAFTDPEVGVCCVNAYFKYPDGVSLNPQKWIENQDDLYSALLFRNVIPGSASSMMVRRQCFDEIGAFDESLPAAEDRDMWFRLVSMYKIVYIDTPLVLIDRSYKGHMSENIERMANGYEGFLRNREKDVPARLRYLLPRAWRYANLRISTSYFQLKDPNKTYLYARRALSTSLPPDSDFCQALRLLLWSLVARYFPGLLPLDMRPKMKET
jgi:glycosyltransferase involved in cell wall biosynthesis